MGTAEGKAGIERELRGLMRKSGIAELEYSIEKKEDGRVMEILFGGKDANGEECTLSWGEVADLEGTLELYASVVGCGNGVLYLTKKGVAA